MTDQPDAGDRVKDLLQEALDQPYEAREAFLRRLEAEDPVLAARVGSLLGAWDRATTVLREPGAPGAPAGEIEGPGDVIGAYTLEARIGEGGFGVVFRARQDAPVARRLAIKLIKPGMDSAAVLARFDAERAALARLTHPAVARIYDAGTTPGGRPFFAMEHVDGLPITDYCDDRRLGIDQRVRLFRAVCDAVQHAHQKGIIHRDLKPSNVLITDEHGAPAPKIIDFGIAKALDDPLTDLSVVTLARQIVGTPLYMPPEQASLDPGRVDTRSDVYSLGALLYELLCGETPVSSDQVQDAGLTGLHRLLSESTAVRPSRRDLHDAAARRASDPPRLRRSLEGDLDWIAARALEADPERRYPSAAALSEDLRRWLDDEAVEASPPGAGYRARKFVRRHRVAVTFAGVVGALVLLLLVVLAGGLMSVRWERNQALRAQEREQAAREEAESVLGFTLGILESARGDRAGRNATILDAVTRAASDIDTRFGDRPLAAARMHETVGNLYRTTGDIESAEFHLRRAVELHEDASGPDDRGTILALNDLALLYSDTGRQTEAREAIEEAHRRAMRVLGPHDESTDLVTANVAALVWMHRGDYELAARELRRVVQRRDRLDLETSLTAQGNFGLALRNLGRNDEAEAIFLRVIEEAEAAGEEGLRLKLSSMNNLASIRLDQDRTDEALETFVEIVAVLEERFGRESPPIVVAMANLASVQQRAGRLDDALATRDEVERRADALLPPGHPNRARLLVGRGRLLMEMDRLDEAGDAFLTAESMLAALDEPPTEAIVEAREMLAEYCERVGRPEEAAAWAAKAEDAR